MFFRRYVGILHKHRDGHRADSARNRSNDTFWFESFKIGIAADFAIYDRNSDIYDDRTWAHHVVFQKPGRSRCYNDDIGNSCELCDILCFLMAHCYGCSCVHKQ